MTHCCNPMTGKCEQGHGCPARETPHDKAARHFYDPGQPLHIEAYEGPGRLARALDWVGNSVSHIAGFGRAVKEGFFNAIRDAWALLPSVLVAAGVVLACVFAAGVLVGFSK